MRILKLLRTAVNWSLTPLMIPASCAAQGQEDPYLWLEEVQGEKALADERINIQMISTSEIKIAVVIDEKYVELAVRVLHKAFELDQE